MLECEMKYLEPSLQQLRLLLSVSEHNGLVRAARRMRLSQSAASHALAALEKNLGLALVTRNRGTLKLTETANRLLPHMRQICTCLNAIRTEISAVSGLQTRSLRLAAVLWVALAEAEAGPPAPPFPPAPPAPPVPAPPAPPLALESVPLAVPPAPPLPPAPLPP